MGVPGDVRAVAPTSKAGTAIGPRRPSQAASGPAVEIAHLRKTYGELVAVDDISLSVVEGEIFGILGPNGAGKTTTVECAIGLRTPDAGTIRAAGPGPAGRPGRGPRDRRGCSSSQARSRTSSGSGRFSTCTGRSTASLQMSRS